ncbi:MAG: hypothetical protein U1E76_18020 [Planctomycetota bacterium]
MVLCSIAAIDDLRAAVRHGIAYMSRTWRPSSTAAPGHAWRTPTLRRSRALAPRSSSFRSIDRAAEEQAALARARELHIKLAHVRELVDQLSGGITKVAIQLKCLR